MHWLIYFLTLCIRETPKRVVLITVKTKMKCRMMQHFTRVYTVCKAKKDLQTKEYNIFFNCNLTPQDMYNGVSQVYCMLNKLFVFVSNQNEEFISIQGVTDFICFS